MTIQQPPGATAPAPLPPAKRSRWRGPALVVVGIAAGVGLVFGIGALTGGDGSAATTPLGRASPAPGDAPLLDPDRLADVTGERVRADSPDEAVTQFLAAEQAGDRATSFAYLADSVRVDYGSVAAWGADHPDALAPVEDFTVEGEPVQTSRGTEVTTDTRYASSLDSIAGLVPARATTTWVAVQEDGGWAVDLSSTTQKPIYPASEDAAVAAQAWVDGQQRCADPVAFTGGVRGRSDLVTAICGASGSFEVGEVARLDQVDAPPLQNSFGADLIGWARVVPISGPVPVRLVLAPVDDAWVVIWALAP